jgi:ankyrin repeat protein
MLSGLIWFTISNFQFAPPPYILLTQIGDKALMKASARGSTDVVELLIGWGVDINAKNNVIT